MYLRRCSMIIIKSRKVNYNIYLRWFEEFTLDLPLNGIIYIKTSPEICNKRILERNRKGEDNIPLDYSIQCHKYHEAWLNKTQRSVLILDGDSSHKTRISDKWLDEIKIFIHPEASPKSNLSIMIGRIKHFANTLC